MKQDVTVFTESADVKVSYISLRLSTPSRHNRAIKSSKVQETLEFYKTTPEELWAYFACSLQAKLAASSVLPWPMYFATCGYGHRGRVRSTTSLVL
jgi:type IV pilus biogenesis protein CpaD/CtpE